MGQSLSAIYVHLIFSTKDRRPFLSDVDIRRKLHKGLAEVCKRQECPALSIGGVDDHVHILFRLTPSACVSNCVRELKSRSTRWGEISAGVFKQFAWQSGFGAFSVDPEGLDVVRQYIENQEEHHREFSFQDELRRILRETGTEWNEEYLWS